MRVRPPWCFKVVSRTADARQSQSAGPADTLQPGFVAFARQREREHPASERLRLKKQPARSNVRRSGHTHFSQCSCILYVLLYLTVWPFGSPILLQCRTTSLHCDHVSRETSKLAGWLAASAPVRRGPPACCCCWSCLSLAGCPSSTATYHRCDHQAEHRCSPSRLTSCRPTSTHPSLRPSWAW